MKEKNNKRSKARKCAVYGCSLVKRAAMAKLGRDDLKVGQPHPAYDQLQFAGYSSRGGEQWRTLSEIDDEEARRDSYKTDEQKATALERKKHSKKLDEEADELYKFYKIRGIERKKFNSLKRSIQKRLLEANADIVITSSTDRQSREEEALAEMAAQNERFHAEAVAAAKAKMERATKLYRTMDVVEIVSMEEIEAANKNRKPLTQSDLNELSNSRYEMPECLSDYAQLEEEFNDEIY